LQIIKCREKIGYFRGTHSKEHEIIHLRQLAGDPEALRLFVRRVPDNTTDADLQDHFSQFGEVLDAAVIRGARS